MKKKGVKKVSQEIKVTKLSEIVKTEMKDIKVKGMFCAKQLGRQYHDLRFVNMIDQLSLHELESVLIYVEKRIKKEKKRSGK